MNNDKAGRPQDGPADAAASPPGRHFLLVIAIDAYEHCPRLYNCEKDATDLIAVLTERYQFEEGHITRLFTRDATRERIHETLRELARKVQANDNLLIYFSGHGELDEDLDEGYWIPVEARRDKHDQYIPNSWILKALKAIKSRHTFLMADACFSGSLFMSKGIEKNISHRSESDPSRWGLSAGRKQVVSDGKPGDNSPFAEALLYRLRGSDKNLGVQELCAYVVEQVKAATEGKQEPIGEPLQVEGHKSGQFYFKLKDDESAAWAATLAQNTIAGYRQYRSRFPQGAHRAEALERMEALEVENAWQTAKTKNTVTGYERFLDQYPDSAYADEANERIEALLQRQAAPPPTAKPTPPPSPAQQPTLNDGLVLIKGGTFDMGDVMGDNEYDREKPLHQVTLSDYYLGAHPVTFEAYDRFCVATQRENPGDKGWGRANRPVINVSWYDAVAYCNWLSAQNGLAPVYDIQGETVTAAWTRNGYRLPTEAEWEYAARALNGKGGGKVRFGNGKDIADPKEINFDSSKEYKKSYSVVGEYRGKTTPVGSFPPNSLGLYDMSGNVWEWCWDWYGVYTSEAQNNPKGPESGSYRVYRGGSWYSYPQDCRVAFRSYVSPGNRDNYLGFRLSRTV